MACRRCSPTPCATGAKPPVCFHGMPAFPRCRRAASTATRRRRSTAHNGKAVVGRSFRQSSRNKGYNVDGAPTGAVAAAAGIPLVVETLAIGLTAPSALRLTIECSSPTRADSPCRAGSDCWTDSTAVSAASLPDLRRYISARATPARRCEGGWRSAAANDVWRLDGPRARR
jgi:hypothetical protein